MRRPLDVLVAGATAAEVAGVREALARPREGTLGGRPWRAGRIGGLAVGVLTTGIGKTNVGLALGAALEVCRPGLLLSVGVAGAFPGCGLEVEDVAVARSELYGDEGVALADGFRAMEEIGLPLWEGPGGRFFTRFPADSRVAAALEEAAAAGGRVVVGDFLTLSTVTGTAARAEELSGRFGAVCETMEGAAVAHAAAARGVPFGELRGISNRVGPRDRPSWRLEAAAAVAGAALVRFLDAWPLDAWPPAGSPAG